MVFRQLSDEFSYIMRRVVVTGMGIISPVGLDVPTAWSNVVQGSSGIGGITLFDVSGEDWRVKIAGEAWGFDPLDYMSAKEARRADRNAQFALGAAAQAIEQARLSISAANADDIGVMIGSASGGIWTYSAQQAVMDARGPRKMNPLLIPMEMIDAAGVQVGMKYGLHGPGFGIASACASGADALAVAFETIMRGDAEVMITGGTEAAVHPLGVAGFDNMGALSRRNDSPKEASRPFDSMRDGFVVSEGAGVLVMESLEHAERRGAEPLAELISCAGTSDGTHPTAPDADARQAARAVRRALKKAGIDPARVDYINAHATGTPVGDPLEVRAYRQVFGDGLPPLSATKSTTGHMLGAAGAVAGIFCVMALRDQTMPPTINCHDIDPECAADVVPDTPRPSPLNVALSAAFGFGGHNMILVWRRL